MKNGVISETEENENSDNFDNGESFTLMDITKQGSNLKSAKSVSNSLSPTPQDKNDSKTFQRSNSVKSGGGGRLQIVQEKIVQENISSKRSVVKRRRNLHDEEL
jgi:hypothetical protein